MTTGLLPSITDELVADLENEARLCDKDTSVFMCPNMLQSLLAERAELKQEVDRLNARLLLSSAHAASTVASCMAQVSGIAGAAAELQRDSDRYRWLRDRIENKGDMVIAKVSEWSIESWSGDDPDAAIDTAMQSEAKP